MRSEADARLIAASPDLLAALLKVKVMADEHVERGGVTTAEVVEEIDRFLVLGDGAAAIARATGAGHA